MAVAKIENFHGVYLLVNKNPEPKHTGKCYIGYTVNPLRRITQHNRGRKHGGANKTSRTPGPWEMVMIVS
jgi:structure-specific endonuclease subunit SLX1